MLNKMKKMKIALLGLCVAGFATAGVALNAGIPSAKAEEAVGAQVTLGENTVNFSLVGASVRITEPLGLRFEARMSVSDYEAVTAYEANGAEVSFGMAVMPKSYVEAYGDLTEETMFGNELTYYWQNMDGTYSIADTTGKVQILNAETEELDAFTVSGTQVYGLRGVIKVKAANYFKDFYVKPYIKIVEGEKTEYKFAGTSEYDTRSISYVAEMGYAIEQAKEEPNEDTVEGLKTVIENAGYTPVATADELYAAMISTDVTKKFRMTNDIDLTNVAIDNSKDFTGNIDANGYTIKGITITESRFMSGMSGSLKNVIVSAMSTSKLTYLFYNLKDGGTLENVYVDMTADMENISNVADTYIFYQASEKVNAVAGTGNLTNVIFDVDYINDSAITKYKLAILGHNEWLNVNMTNVYNVSDKAARLFYEKWNMNGVITVKNGNDEYTADDTMSSLNYGDTYVFVSMSHFVKSEYVNTFTADMWKDIIVYNAEEYYKVDQDKRAAELASSGYKAISTGEELKTVLETENSSAKYYLANDIDMTGVSITSSKVFAGTLDGNGHKVYNITYTNKLIGYINGTWKNISFYATRTGTGEVGFINEARTSTMENVYIDLTLDVQNLSGSLFGGIIAHTRNGSATVTLNNVLANVHFINNTNNVAVGSDGFGLVWRFRGSQLTMQNAYFVMEGLASKYYLGLIHNFYSASSVSSRSYSITNGTDNVIEGTRTETTASVIKAGQDYCYTSFETFKGTAYDDAFTGRMWDVILGREA